MGEFVMPALGADMERGMLVEWQREVGDPVSRGEVVAVIETQKGAIEIEVFEDGVLEEILVGPGETVPVGTVLARIGDGSGVAKPAARPAEPALAQTREAPPAAAEPGVAPQPAPARLAARAPSPGRTRVSPVARRRARELGIDLATLSPSGRGGAIRLADVEAARTGERLRPAAPKRQVGFDRDAMRQAIAAAMAKSKREIPHYYLATGVDMTAATAWLEQANAERPVERRLLPGVLLLKASALALRQVPELNGFWIDGRPQAADRVHMGWAVSLRGGGLMAPAIHDADEKSLDELMAAMRDLVKRARTGGIRGSEMTDPTATVTSLGERGAESVYGGIYPPQVALIGFGRIADAPAVAGGRVEARPRVRVTLAADHRASDGHTGGRLLAAIETLLQEPGKL